MAKKLVLVAVLIVGGLVAYNVVTTGELSLVPSSNLSPEEQQLNALEERIDAADREISAAGRAAGLAGIDTTAGVEPALRDLERVERELIALKNRTQSETLRKRAERLLHKARALKG